MASSPAPYVHDDPLHALPGQFLVGWQDSRKLQSVTGFEDGDHLLVLGAWSSRILGGALAPDETSTLGPRENLAVLAQEYPDYRHKCAELGRRRGTKRDVRPLEGAHHKTGAAAVAADFLNAGYRRRTS